MKAAFTYASSLSAEEETQANPLKIEDFEPKAAAAPAKEKAAEAAPASAGAAFGAPAEESPAKQQSDTASLSSMKGSKSTVQNEKQDALESDRACCDSCIVA